MVGYGGRVNCSHSRGLQVTRCSTTFCLSPLGIPVPPLPSLPSGSSQDTGTAPWSLALSSDQPISYSMAT